MRQVEQELKSIKGVCEEKYALELEKKKLELAEKKGVKPKLPDLQTYRFQETHLDWVRFWNIFSSRIDKTSIPNDSSGYKKAKEFFEKRICADLIRTDQEWKKWVFGDLVEALRQWVERNPSKTG